MSADERDALIEAHLPQVRFVADRLAAKLPASVEREDLVSAGVIGLIDAVNRYDASRGVLFKTFAEMRIRGAMLDSLRDLDWVPRSVRRRARDLEAAFRKIEQEQGRMAEGDEVAEALGISLGDLQSLLGEVRALTITGLDQPDEDGVLQVRQLADPDQQSPLGHYEVVELRERLAAAVDRLPERERQVVALYYLEELTMREIGAVLGVTESRVSQLHTSAVLHLRAALSTAVPSRAIA